MSDSSVRRSPRRVPPWLMPRLAGESEHDHRARQNEQYFSEQVVENHDWWKRVGERFNFRNAKVLDLGCGHGALSISIAEAGASEVFGVDLDADRITFASNVVRQRYPSLAGKVRFACEDIRSLPQRHHYDYVLSKDSFEHIEDLQSVINSIGLVLKPGGKLIVGFSPLYYSPFGDHGNLRLPRLWLHALLPEKWLLRWVSGKERRKIEKISDLGLNKLTPAQFRSVFPASRWRTVSLKYNRGPRRLMPVMSALRKIPLLEKYFTVSIYGVFETAMRRTKRLSRAASSPSDRFFAELATSNRRQAPRARVSLPVHVRPFDSKYPETVCASLNMSRDGLFFVTSAEHDLEHYSRDMKVYVTRNFHPNDPANQEEIGDVVRVEQRGDGKWGVAISIAGAAKAVARIGA